MSSFFKIDGYPIDCAISEQPTREAEVTAFPVEKNSNLTDHRRRKPITFKIEGLVTDTPIGAIALDPTRQALTGADIQSKFAYDFLVGVDERNEPVTIETSFGKFENMELTSLVPIKDQKTGKALKFTAEFTQIRLITNSRTTIRVATPRAANKTNLGNLESPNQVLTNVLSVTLVVCYPIAQRPGFRVSLGDPIFTRHAIVGALDCYPIQGDMNPDGYLTKNGSSYTYHPMSFQSHANLIQDAIPNPNKPVEPKPVSDKELHYNYATKRWEDNMNNAVTQSPPPDNKPDLPGTAWKRISSGRG